jgi:hypothetical protein
MVIVGEDECGAGGWGGFAGEKRRARSNELLSGGELRPFEGPGGA